MDFIPKPQYPDVGASAHVTNLPRHVETFAAAETNDVDAKLEILRLRDELIGALAREGELRARLFVHENGMARGVDHMSIFNHAQVVERNSQLEDQIDTILKSRTWRIGAFLLWPSKAVRRILRSRG